MKITFSILCYNYGRFLKQAIESCLIQKVEGCEPEILVINDGSTDNTSEICEAFRDQIKIVSEGNQGFGSSLSRAIKHASGEYVFLLDADDFFHPRKLEAFLPHFRKGVLFAFNKSRMVNERGEVIIPESYASGSTSTIAVNRAAALHLLPVENELSFHVIDSMGYGIFLDEVLTGYRVHGNSMTDRKQPGRQNTYLAGVTHRLADRIKILAQESTLPFWMQGPSDAMKVARDYRSLAYYNELETSLELKRPIQSYGKWLKMVWSALLSNKGLKWFHFKMLVKTILMSPSFPKS